MNYDAESALFQLWLTSGSMGTIGFGLPVAVGAQFAQRNCLMSTATPASG
jgi:thiamine pyrophosphate-dependent acetolactate synthase large subunit-like protein